MVTTGDNLFIVHLFFLHLFSGYGTSSTVAFYHAVDLGFSPSFAFVQMYIFCSYIFTFFFFFLLYMEAPCTYYEDEEDDNLYHRRTNNMGRLRPTVQAPYRPKTICKRCLVSGRGRNGRAGAPCSVLFWAGEAGRAGEHGGLPARLGGKELPATAMPCCCHAVLSPPCRRGVCIRRRQGRRAGGRHYRRLEELWPENYAMWLCGQVQAGGKGGRPCHQVKRTAPHGEGRANPVWHEQAGVMVGVLLYIPLGMQKSDCLPAGWLVVG